MRLNRGKCCQINMNCRSQVKFHTGEKMKIVLEAKYLGGQLNNRADHKVDLSIRLGMAAGTWKRLTLLWNKTRCKPAWKILVFNAVVISQLLYGLETIPFTAAMETKINAFQQRCLRRILKIDPAYYSRIKKRRGPGKGQHNRLQTTTHTRRLGERINSRRPQRY